MYCIVAFMYDVLLGLAVAMVGTIVGVFLWRSLSRLLKRAMSIWLMRPSSAAELMDFFRFRGEEMGTGQRVGPYVQAMQAFDRGSLMYEEPQSALLWTILCLIPGINIIAIILTLFWLTDYAPGHDRRFYGFAQNAHYASEQISMGPLLSGTWKSISERSYVLYLIISVLLPAFAIWWFYVLIKDLNDHFDNEWMFEDNLMSGLQKCKKKWKRSAQMRFILPIVGS